MKRTQYYENNGITTKIDYFFIGYDKDAKSVYGKNISVFSIPEGLIKVIKVFPNCFYR